MKILIIGATGKVGGKTVDACLDAGHAVTGFGRSVEELDAGRPGLSVHKGDVTSDADLAAAMPGHDAVILTFGAIPSRETILHKPDLCEKGTCKTIDAMKAAGVPRLVAMTAIGAGDSKGHGRFVFRNIIEPVLLDRIMQDRTAQEEVVRASDLTEWVIVRPTELSDEDPAPVRVIRDLEAEPEPTTISRTDVGTFLARMATDTAEDGTTILITN